MQAYLHILCTHTHTNIPHVCVSHFSPLHAVDPQLGQTLSFSSTFNEETKIFFWPIMTFILKGLECRICACAPLKAGSNCYKLSTGQHSSSRRAWFCPLIYINVNLNIFMWQWCLERPKRRNITASSPWQIHVHTRKDTRNIK